MSSATENKAEAEGDAKPKEEVKPAYPTLPKVPFRCQRCGLCEDAHHFGTRPDFCRKLAKFTAPTFLMLDPFTPLAHPAEITRGRAPFLILGGVCCMCEEKGGEGVCQDCSVFHVDRWWCLDCASAHLNEFPTDVQAKIQRKLQTAAKSVRQ